MSLNRNYKRITYTEISTRKEQRYCTHDEKIC